MVSNGLERIYNNTCPPGTIYLVKKNHAEDGVQGCYEKRLGKALVLVQEDTQNKNTFSLQSEDGENLSCRVKPKHGFDIVVVIEK